MTTEHHFKTKAQRHVDFFLTTVDISGSLKTSIILLIFLQFFVFKAISQCNVQDCTYIGPQEPCKGALILDDIRVLAMNVYGQKGDWGDSYCEKRLKKTGEFIADANPLYNIIGLTEVHPDYSKITCDGNALVEGIQKNGEYGSGKHRWGHPETSWLYYDGGLALFSTSQFDWTPYDKHVHKFSFNPISRTTSGFIFAQIVMNDEVTIDLYITHLHSKNSIIADCSRNCRYQELEELAKGIHERSALSGNPVLVMGDFNIGGPNPDANNCAGNCGYSDIMSVLRNPRDLWLERSSTTVCGSTHKEERIDYIFVMTDSFFTNSQQEIFLSGRERIQKVAWKMDDGAPVSDHLGLSATLEIREKVEILPHYPCDQILKVNDNFTMN